MRVYVINLAVARQRLAHMERILGDAGIRFERFDAVDASRAIAHRCFKLIPPMVERRWTADELGCLFSHYEVWCRIAAGPDRLGAVMEDDLFVDPRLKSLLDGDIKLPCDADLIKLETVAAKTSVSRLARYGSQAFRVHRLRSLHCGTGAYLVSRVAAKKLIGLIELFDIPIDRALFSASHPVGNQMNVYQVVPALAIQNKHLADAFRRPELNTSIGRARDLADELQRAMLRTKSMALSECNVRQITPARHRLLSALVRRLQSAKKNILEKELVVPFALGSRIRE